MAQLGKIVLSKDEAVFHKHFVSWLAEHPSAMPLKPQASDGKQVPINNSFFFANEPVLAAALRLSGGKFHRHVLFGGFDLIMST